MIDFWIFSALLMAIAIGFIVMPLFMKRGTTVGEVVHRTAANVALYEERMLELEHLRTASDLTEEEFSRLQMEYQRTLLDDSAMEGNESDDESSLADVSFSLDVEVSNRNQVTGKGRLLILCMAVILPVSAILFYGERGNIDDWEIARLVKDKAQQYYQGHSKGEDVDTSVITKKLVSSLVARLKKDPEKSESWYLLAQNYMELKSYQNARESYGEVLKQYPQDSKILAAYAQAMYLEEGSRLTPEVNSAIDRVLSIDPHNATVLGLQGISAYESGDFSKAIAFWQKLLSSLPPHSSNAQYIQRGIASAEEQLAARGEVFRKPEDTEAKAPIHSVTLQVSIAPEFVADATSTVFVYARAVGGPRMPLAIVKMVVADLPKEVILDDSMSVMSGQKMSDYPQIEIVARVSKNGTPMPQPGDLEGISDPLSVQDGVKLLALVIDKQVP